MLLQRLGKAEATGGREILLEMPDARDTRDGQCLHGSVQLPGEGDLLRGGVVLRGYRVDHRVNRLAVVASGGGAGVPW